VPEFEVAGWNGLFLPARTRAEIVTKVRHDAIAAIAHPPVKQKLGEMGVDVVTSTPAELAAHLKSEMAKWGTIIKEVGIKAD
jgi:tripartite-type tricarboxylate transporter receptor subunit TctC